MRKLFALFAATLMVAASLSAQEMPADIKTQLEAKASELNPDNPVGAKTWIGKQKSAWESIQNTTLSAAPEDVAAIKASAEKKYPLDFVSQEVYISTAAQNAASIAEFEIPLGESFKAMKDAALKKANGDFEMAYNDLQNQAQAKADLDAISAPDGMDDMTFAITKQVIASKFKGDYVAQLDAAKKVFEAKSAAAETTSEKKADAPEQNVPASMSSLMNTSKELFAKQTLVVEGSTPSSALLAEIKNVKVVLIPSSAYIPGQQLSIINNVGEAVVYQQKNVYISKFLPVVMIIPDSIPAGVDPIKILPSKEYRNEVGKTLFFVGYQKQNVYAFPVKITTISDVILRLTTSVPGTFYEGTAIFDGESKSTLSIAVDMMPQLQKANWMNVDDVKSLQRKFSRAMDRGLNKNLVCIRLDKLGGWEQLSDERLTEDREALIRARSLVTDFITLFAANRMENALSSPTIGSLVKKHYTLLKSRSDPARFDKLYRQFLQELVMMITSETKSANPKARSSDVKIEMKILCDVLQNLSDSIQKAQMDGSYRSSYKDDIKNAQGMK